MRTILGVVAATAALSACAATSAVETDSQATSAEVTTAASSVTPKDPDLLPLIDAAALHPCPQSESNPGVAVPGLPSITLRCLGHGPDVNLAGIRGAPLIVNVWASWCPPCIAEMPILASAATDLRGRVQFLGVDIQDRDERALEMLAAFGADFPSVVDEPGQIRGLLGISGPPVTFFVDERGVIVGRHDGFLPSTEYLNSLVAEYFGIRR